jgi:tetratricopeptide (TPR) repeat protein
MSSGGALGPAAAAGAAAAYAPPAGLNPIWLAQSKLRRRRFDEAIEICGAALAANPYDQAAWYLKARALTLKNWIDDSEIEEEVRPRRARARQAGWRLVMRGRPAPRFRAGWASAARALLGVAARCGAVRASSRAHVCA